MRVQEKLTVIKTIHTAIWLFFNVVIFYMGYAVIIDKIDKWVWICISLITLEGLALLLFKRMCPVTLIARKYSTSTKDNGRLSSLVSRYSVFDCTSFTLSSPSSSQIASVV